MEIETFSRLTRTSGGSQSSRATCCLPSRMNRSRRQSLRGSVSHQRRYRA